MASSRIKVLRTTIIAWLAGMSASCVMSQNLILFRGNMGRDKKKRI
ncbi:MAG: hypothetical protein LBR36_04330 [Bacteroidales bacterium]|nr:hypothetical protein [Bacteroidales bacterium]